MAGTRGQRPRERPCLGVCGREMSQPCKPERGMTLKGVSCSSGLGLSWLCVPVPCPSVVFPWASLRLGLALPSAPAPHFPSRRDALGSPHGEKCLREWAWWRVRQCLPCVPSVPLPKGVWFWICCWRSQAAHGETFCTDQARVPPKDIL